MSNTAAIVALGTRSLNARITAASAALCNGANSANASTCSITSSSIKADSLNNSPPATTR